jgi:DNA-binding NarL/FixJ family response regulator
MDVFMEPVDGIDATRRIRDAFPDAKIVMVTQCPDTFVRKAAHEAGACEYLLKDNLLDVRRFLQAQANARG